MNGETQCSYSHTVNVGDCGSWLCAQVMPDALATLWTVARQASLSMGFLSQEHWSGLPCPSQGNLADPGFEPASPALAGRFFTTEPQGKPTLQNRSQRSIPDCHSDCGKSPKARTGVNSTGPNLPSLCGCGQVPVPGHSEPL